MLCTLALVVLLQQPATDLKVVDHEVRIKAVEDWLIRAKSIADATVKNHRDRLEVLEQDKRDRDQVKLSDTTPDKLSEIQRAVDKLNDPKGQNYVDTFGPAVGGVITLIIASIPLYLKLRGHMTDTLQQAIAFQPPVVKSGSNIPDGIPTR